MLRRVLSERIEFEVILSGGLGNVQVDAGQIDQVLLNLVINARDAMLQGRGISIETNNVELDAHHAEIDVPPGKYVLLAVSDTGVGMDEKVRVRIFESFFLYDEGSQSNPRF